MAESTKKGLAPVPKNLVPINKTITETINFEGQDFIYYKKGTTWYIVLVVFGLVVIGLSVLFKQYSLAIAIFVGIAVMLQLSNRRPNKVNCQFGPSGLAIGSKVYQQNKIKSFWIVPDKETSTLYINSMQKLQPTIFVHVANQNIGRVYEFMAKYFVQEQTVTEEVSNWFNKLLRF